MLEPDDAMLDEIAVALADQGAYDQCRLVNTRTGEVLYWTRDGGVDGVTPVEIDEIDSDDELIVIEPLPSAVWYRGMADFAGMVGGGLAEERLRRAIQGKGSFRRFGNALHRDFPQFVKAWNALRDARAKRRAVDWLAEHGLIDDEVAARLRVEFPG